MKKVLESFKNLYKGEDVAKRHWMYVLLLIIPALCGSMRYVLDKDTPKELLAPAIIIFGVLALASLTPWILLLGFSGDFYKLRLDNTLGLPMINKETIVKGFKILPISLVWGIYSLIFIGITLILPIIATIFGFTSNKPETLTIILTIVFFVILYLIVILALLCLAPFTRYLIISFIEDYKYKAEYFNPFIIFSYMKKAFKETMLVLLKFILASIVINFATSILFVVVIFVTAIAGILAAVVGSADPETAMYTPIALLITMPVIAICSTIQTYANSMVGFAAGENYVEVYKDKIKEKKEEDKNNLQQTEELK